MLRLLDVVPAVLAAAVLAGCVTTPPPTATPAATRIPAAATPAPAPTATPPPAATAAPVQEPRQEPAQVFVERVDVHLLESYPIQVRVVVAGHTPDACTTVTGVETRRAGNRFIVTLTATRAADQVCAQALTPFEQSVSLDVTALPGGVYTVDVHGLTTDVILPDYVGGEPVIETPVAYVLALVAAPIYTAQDASSPVVGTVAPGMVARVTGQDPIGLWWRVICPDDTVGDCWVSANPAVTQPATSP